MSMSIKYFAYHTRSGAGLAGELLSERSTLLMSGLILAAREEPDT